ncbi:hypothetical protein AB0N07_08945 [Streptomyces sp. NPDC051172]|uniref:hypothetical protein n=1 Tax=Streptomyces sp. NPDC051172 TaxID=3155796 RepID=UPI003444640B
MDDRRDGRPGGVRHVGGRRIHGTGVGVRQQLGTAVLHGTDGRARVPFRAGHEPVCNGALDSGGPLRRRAYGAQRRPR